MYKCIFADTFNHPSIFELLFQSALQRASRLNVLKMTNDLMHGMFSGSYMATHSLTGTGNKAALPAKAVDLIIGKELVLMLHNSLSQDSKYAIGLVMAFAFFFFLLTFTAYNSHGLHPCSSVESFAQWACMFVFILWAMPAILSHISK